MSDFFDTREDGQIDFPAEKSEKPILYRMEWGATKGISATIKADWENYKKTPYAPKYGLRYWDKEAKENVQVSTCNFAVVAIVAKLQGKKANGKTADGKDNLQNAWSNYVRDTRKTPFVVRYGNNTIFKGLYKDYRDGGGNTPENDFLEFKPVMILYVAELGLCEIESSTFINAMTDAASMSVGRKVGKFELPNANVAYSICGEGFAASKTSSEFFIAPNFCIRAMGEKGIANVAAQREILNTWLDKHEAEYTEMAGAAQVTTTVAPPQTQTPQFQTPQATVEPPQKEANFMLISEKIKKSGRSAAEVIQAFKDANYYISAFVESSVLAAHKEPLTVKPDDDLPF